MLSSCGSGAEEPDVHSLLVNEAFIKNTASETSQPQPVSALLDFWRDIQFQNYAAAYAAMSSNLRDEIRYRRFVNSIAPARGLFLIRPSVDHVDGDGRSVTIDLILQKGEIVTPEDQLIGFNMVREQGEWVIATDPYNLFKVPGLIGRPQDSGRAAR